MPIFNIRQNRLEKIKEIPFKDEKEIQSLTEGSMQSVFGIEFVRNQFELNKLRIDTLAYDNESKSFVIIEFKKEKFQRHRSGLRLFAITSEQ